MHHTHNVTEQDGKQYRLSQVRCSGCDNIWWVTHAQEFAPSYCCYCGMKFRWYEDVDNVQRNLAGQPTRGG